MEHSPEPLPSGTSEDSSSKPRQVDGAESNKDKKNIVQWVKKKLRRNNQPDTSLREEIQEVIEEFEGGSAADSEEREIFINVLNFNDAKVSGVMTPRLDIRAVTDQTSLPDLIAYIRENEHTRLPIYRENLDDVIGFLHIKDLLRYWGDGKNFKIADILRPIIFVPPTMKISKLLERMKLDRTHMAIVVDEYGGTDGLITIEDLVEEIVGEIEDEHDDEEETLLRTVDGGFEVNARLEIEELEGQLQANLRAEDEDFDTVGGFIFTRMGKVPETGESYESEQGWKFEILSADNRKIEWVRVSRVEKQ